MPYSFSGQPKQTSAKLSVVKDGNMFVAGTSGLTMTFATPTTMSAFRGVPVRSATGVWSITTKDPAPTLIGFDVKALMASGTYLGTQLNKVTLDSSGRSVLAWTFNVAGTATDIAAGSQCIVSLEYSESSLV